MDKTKKLLLLLVIILFLVLSLISLVYFISTRTSFFGKAYGPSASSGSNASYMRLENCYLFASPLQAKADDKEKIRVTAFILDSQGKGVAGEAVFLNQNEKLTINPVMPVTDDLGRAIFDLSTSSIGEYIIEAKVSNKTLPQKINVNFR